MSTTTTRPGVDLAPIEDTDPTWRSMLDEWGRHYWRRIARHSASPYDWPPGWLLPIVVGVGLLLVGLLVYGLVVPFVRWVASFAAAAVNDGAGWLRDWAITRVVLDPVRDYLTAHSAGLPITADTLWWTWATAGIGFFLLAWFFRAVAARIGWILFGTATVAMVWATTTGPARETTAGIAALWWIVLSLLALRRSWSPPKSTVHLPELRWLASILQNRQ
jgi:hypothetical protein